jgi:hypothetical protein
VKPIYDHKTSDILPHKEFMRIAKESEGTQCRLNKGQICTAPFAFRDPYCHECLRAWKRGKK